MADSTSKLIIIGSGPAGLTAAIYAARADLKPIVIAGYQPGGQLMTTSTIENFPGFPDGIEGPELMQRMMKQAEKFGAQMVYSDVNFVDLSGPEKVVKTAEAEYKASTIIIASGALPKRLEIPGEQELYGRGVSTCATCDGALFKDKIIAVVGGGDAAMEEATFLTRFASKLYLIHRGSEFRASQVMQDRVLHNSKIEVLWNTEVKQVVEEAGKLGHLKLFNNKTQSDSELKVDGMFLAIGHLPVTGFLHDKLALSDLGYVQAVDHVKTTVAGVFTAGDVEDSKYRQAVTAAGLGCMAALEAQKYLESKETLN